jgi:hypothetical protein
MAAVIDVAITDASVCDTEILVGGVCYIREELPGYF